MEVSQRACLAYGGLGFPAQFVSDRVHLDLSDKLPSGTSMRQEAGVQGRGQ